MKTLEQMNYNKIKFDRDYISGFSLKKESLRKHKYTIVESDEKQMIGKTFFSETVTPKKDGRHLTGETYFYVDSESKIYKRIKWLLKSIANNIN